MSTAFRNFFIVFIIFLLIFGIVAWQIVVPWIDENLLSDNDTEETSEVSEDASQSDVSDAGTEEQDGRKVSIAFVGMADKDYLADIFFIRIDEEKGVYLTTDIPFDTKVDNGGKYAPLYSYLYLRSPKEIMQTVPYLVGYDVDYYAVFDFAGLYEIISKLGSVSVTLENEIRVYNPDFMDEIQEYLDNDEPVPEAFYNVYGPGNVRVDDENLQIIWNYSENEGKNDFTLKNRIYEATFYALTKQSDLGADLSRFESIVSKSVATSLGSEAFEKYGDIMFANSHTFKNNGSLRILYIKSYAKMVEEIRAAMGDY